MGNPPVCDVQMFHVKHCAGRETAISLRETALAPCSIPLIRRGRAGGKHAGNRRSGNRPSGNRLSRNRVTVRRAASGPHD